MNINYKNYFNNNLVYATVNNVIDGVEIEDDDVKSVFENLNNKDEAVGIIGVISHVVKHIFKYIFSSSYRNKFTSTLKLINDTHEKLQAEAQSVTRVATPIIMRRSSEDDLQSESESEQKDLQSERESKKIKLEAKLDEVKTLLTEPQAKLDEIAQILERKKIFDRLSEFSQELPALFTSKEQLQQEVQEKKAAFDKAEERRKKDPLLITKKKLQADSDLAEEEHNESKENLEKVIQEIKEKFEKFEDLFDLKGLNIDLLDIDICQQLLEGKIAAYKPTDEEASILNDEESVKKLNDEIFLLNMSISDTQKLIDALNSSVENAVDKEVLFEAEINPHAQPVQTPQETVVHNDREVKIEPDLEKGFIEYKYLKIVKGKDDSNIGKVGRLIQKKTGSYALANIWLRLLDTFNQAYKKDIVKNVSFDEKSGKINIQLKSPPASQKDRTYRLWVPSSPNDEGVIELIGGALIILHDRIEFTPVANSSEVKEIAGYEGFVRTPIKYSSFIKFVTVSTKTLKYLSEKKSIQFFVEALFGLGKDNRIVSLERINESWKSPPREVITTNESNQHIIERHS